MQNIDIRRSWPWIIGGAAVGIFVLAVVIFAVRGDGGDGQSASNSGQVAQPTRPTPAQTTDPTATPIPTAGPSPTPTPTPAATPAPVIWVYETNYSPSSVSVSADGDYVAVGSSEEIYLLGSNGDLLWNYPTSFPIIDVSMTADASYILAGGSKAALIPDGIVYSLTKQGDLESSFELTGVSSVFYSADGNYFAMTYVHGLGWNDVVALWSENEGKWLWDYTFGRHETAAVSVSADGQYIAVGGAAIGSSDSGLRLYDKAGNLLWEYAIGGVLAGDKYSVSISADGKYVAAGNEDNDQLYLFERDQQLLWSYSTGPVQSVSVSADGSRIVAANRDKIYLFDGFENLLWEFEISNIEDVAISPDADTIVVVTEDNKVYALKPPL